MSLLRWAWPLVKQVVVSWLSRWMRSVLRLLRHSVRDLDTPMPVASNVWAANITFKPALRDWLDRTVRVSRIVGMILNNPMVSVFLDVTPGAREIVILSAVVGHLDNFDQVIVDMPASGHAVGMLKIPDTAHKLMRTGPIHDRAGEIMSFLRGPDTAMGIVALPRRWW